MAAISALVDPLATLIAAFFGAWLAFRYERQSRKDDQVERHIAAANRALYTLYNFWNVLKQYHREAISEFKEAEDQWLNLPATLPAEYGLTKFDAVELTFLLSSPDPMTFTVVLLEEQRFAQVINQIHLRSRLLLEQVHQRFGIAGVAVGTPLPEPAVEEIVGIHNVHVLKVITPAIVENVEQNLVSLEHAHNRLRSTIQSMYPSAKLIQIQFREADGT